MSHIWDIIKRYSRKILIFLQYPLIYIFISYLLLFSIFLMEIYEAYTNHVQMNVYHYNDIFFNDPLIY